MMREYSQKASFGHTMPKDARKWLRIDPRINGAWSETTTPVVFRGIRTFFQSETM